MSKIQPTFVDVMRHGEPEGACPKGGTILRGSIDHELTSKGWLQAEQRIRSLDNSVLANESWDVIISSPLKRCSAFAQKLASNTLEGETGLHDRIPLHIKNSWRELHYGDWEGLSTQTIWQDQPEIMEKMWQKPLEFCAPNGEPVKDFSQRIEQAWLDLLAEFQGQRILLICHGGVMRILLQQLLLMAPEGMNRFAIPYAAMSRFRVDHSLDENSSYDSSDETCNDNKILHWPSLLTHLGDEIK